MGRRLEGLDFVGGYTESTLQAMSSESASNDACRNWVVYNVSPKSSV